MKKFLILIFLLSGLGVTAQPVMKGGLEGFINANIIYPAFSYQNCIQGLINVSFKINKRGEVYSSRVSRGFGIDLDQEALRLIRMTSGKWQVAADYDTASVLVAPVNFKLSSADCSQVSKQEMNKAILAYKATMGLTDAITNFYRNKEAGNYDEADQGRITALKKELGYDEAYLVKKIEEGERKLKQKDRQGACEDFLFIKYMGSDLADELLKKYCK